MSQRDQNQSLTNSDLLRMEQFSSMLLGYSDQSTIKDFFSDRNYDENSTIQSDQNRSFSPINIRQSLNSSPNNEFPQSQEFGDETFSFKEENEMNYQNYRLENMELKREIETLQYQIDQLVIEINKENQLRTQINKELTRIKKCINMSQQQQQQSSKYQNNFYLKKNKNQTRNHFRSRNTNNSSKSMFLETNQNDHPESKQNIFNNNFPKKRKKEDTPISLFLYKKK